MQQFSLTSALACSLPSIGVVVTKDTATFDNLAYASMPPASSDIQPIVDAVRRHTAFKPIIHSPLVDKDGSPNGQREILEGRLDTLCACFGNFLAQYWPGSTLQDHALGYGAALLAMFTHGINTEHIKYELLTERPIEGDGFRFIDAPMWSRQAAKAAGSARSGRRSRQPILHRDPEEDRHCPFCAATSDSRMLRFWEMPAQVWQLGFPAMVPGNPAERMQFMEWTNPSERNGRTTGFSGLISTTSTVNRGLWAFCEREGLPPIAVVGTSVGHPLSRYHQSYEFFLGDLPVSAAEVEDTELYRGRLGRVRPLKGYGMPGYEIQVSDQCIEPGLSMVANAVVRAWKDVCPQMMSQGSFQGDLIVPAQPSARRVIFLPRIESAAHLAQEYDNDIAGFRSNSIKSPEWLRELGEGLGLSPQSAERLKISEIGGEFRVYTPEIFDRMRRGSLAAHLDSLAARYRQLSSPPDGLIDRFEKALANLRPE